MASSALQPGPSSVPSFPLNKDGYVYRPLKRGIPLGWDVYALQTGLSAAGLAVGTPDGDFGPKTYAAVRGFQEQQGLVQDGIAGSATQRALCLYVIFPVQRQRGVTSGLMKGQVESECGFQVGNHPPQYSNGSWDAGVTQRNTVYAPLVKGFDMLDSLQVLAIQLRSKYEEYKGYGKVTSERRLWELAAGSWNRPAWTDKLAKGGTLTAQQSSWIEGYIDRVTTYLAV